MGKRTKKLASKFTGLILAGCLFYLFLICTIGFRIPGFHMDDFSLPTVYENDDFKLSVEGGFLKQTGHQFLIRAYSPHLEIHLSGHLIAFPIVIENIHPDSKLAIESEHITVKELKSNLNRKLIVHGRTITPLRLKWNFPEKDHYRFMALGDTGGGKELEWALIRAKQLNADFIVHLGDMFYSPQDVHSAFNTIQNSTLPVFNVYGNHDYRNGDDEYPEENTFNEVFAPSNFQFLLLDKLFVILDTASHIFPFNKGKRGKFLKNISTRPLQNIKETVVFTHKPVLNNITKKYPEINHGLSGFEGYWLEEKLVGIGSNTLVSGHIHKSLEILDTILPTYIAGEGIAHTDLITDQPTSKVLIGDIRSNQPIRFSWHSNNIPRSYQVSKRSLHILETHLRNLAANESKT